MAVYWFFMIFCRFGTPTGEKHPEGQFRRCSARRMWCLFAFLPDKNCQKRRRENSIPIAFGIRKVFAFYVCHCADVDLSASLVQARICGDADHCAEHCLLYSAWQCLGTVPNHICAILIEQLAAFLDRSFAFRDKKRAGYRLHKWGLLHERAGWSTIR